MRRRRIYDSFSASQDSSRCTVAACVNAYAVLELIFGIVAWLLVNVITNIDNGVGLQREAELLVALLQQMGHQATPVHFARPGNAAPADVNIFDEVVNLDLLRLAPINWIFPHPEWWLWHEHVDRFDLILAKTRDCYEIFKGQTDRVAHVGFMSADHLLPEIPRDKCLHVQGASRLKNTAAIIDCWRYYHPSLPLTVVSHTQHADKIDNVTFTGRVADDELRRLQNSHLFHLCPSEYEGWGHYLHEGLGVGAVVVTTDAPPMNETACPVDLRVPVEERYQVNAALASRVTPGAVANSIEKCLRLDGQQIKMFRQEARVAYEAERAEFKEKFAHLFETVPKAAAVSAKPSPKLAAPQEIQVAIMSVPRTPSYLQQTIASLLLSNQQDRSAFALRVMVGVSDRDYLAQLTHHKSADIEYASREKEDEVRELSVHRRLAFNLSRTLTKGAPPGCGLCVCEDDIVFADGFLGKLARCINEIESQQSPKYVLAVYSHYDFAAEPSRARGKYYCSYNATVHYGNCCFYVSAPLRDELAAYLTAECVQSANAPADIALGTFCENLWRRGEGGMYQTVSSLAQHVGVVSGGTSGKYFASPTFGRPWPD